MVAVWARLPFGVLVTRRLRSAEGATIGEVFTFMSGLYFRGKLAYASAFANPPEGCPGVQVIVPGLGLQAPATSIRLAGLRAIARVPVDPDNRRYREPLQRDAALLAGRLGDGDTAVLLGSIATPKYLDPLKEVLGSRTFDAIGANSKLAFALGQDVAGQPFSADLAKMPHVLIAGATGSGKSVCVNAIICSLLMNATPVEVQLILIDPKRVEMAMYKGLPHLLTEVIVEPEKAVNALKWTVGTMESRYHEFAQRGVRNIGGYNESLRPGEPVMPYILVVIDELADLMMVSAYEVESTITRIAQLARATGIHLVVATQRPSVQVITGLIKANIPSRIAFAMTSGVDSRTILDAGGAEDLLGRGDMLYLPIDAPRAAQRLLHAASDQRASQNAGAHAGAGARRASGGARRRGRPSGRGHRHQRQDLGQGGGSSLERDRERR